MVKIFPDLIVGYNTLSKEQKQKVDINGLSSMMRTYLVVLGILVIDLELLFKILEMKSYYTLLVTSILIVIVVIFMIVKARKYYKT